MSNKLAKNPYPVLLPESLILGQLSAAMGSFIKGTAWEIGERFDLLLTPLYGSDWLTKNFGGQYTPNLHDPDFVLDWHPEHSILWKALPPYSPDLKSRFGKARLTRNRWEHETAKQNMNSFLNGVDQLRRLADSLQLDTASYAPLLVKRIGVLQKAGGVLPPTVAELEIQRQKEMAEEALSAANAAVAQAEALGAQMAEAQELKAEALRRAAEAEAEVEALERRLLEAGKLSRQSLTEPADDLEPGSMWGEIPLGARVLTLKANMVDLMDLTTQTLLSQQIGDVAIDAARRWLKFMPRGGRVHLTPAGHAAGQVGSSYVYLGRIDSSDYP